MPCIILLFAYCMFLENIHVGNPVSFLGIAHSKAIFSIGILPICNGLRIIIITVPQIKQSKIAISELTPEYREKFIAVSLPLHEKFVEGSATKAGLLKGRTNRFKKAYVTLAGEDKIDFYSNI